MVSSRRQSLGHFSVRKIVLKIWNSGGGRDNHRGGEGGSHPNKNIYSKGSNIRGKGRWLIARPSISDTAHGKKLKFDHCSI